MGDLRAILSSLFALVLWHVLNLFFQINGVSAFAAGAFAFVGAMAILLLGLRLVHRFEARRAPAPVPASVPAAPAVPEARPAVDPITYVEPRLGAAAPSLIPVAGAAPPSLTLGQFVATEGIFPASGEGTAMFTMGFVHSFAGGGQDSVAPWSMPQADGQLVPIKGNEALFSVIGSTYGGTVPTNFGLPNLKGLPATLPPEAPFPLPAGTTPLTWLIADDGAAIAPPPTPPPAPVIPHGAPPPPPMPPMPPVPSVQNVPVTGMVAMFAGTSAPGGWLVCDGSLIAQADHPALHAKIGRAFGWLPDGRVALPQLTGEVVVGPPAGQVPGQTRPWWPGDSFTTNPPALVLNFLICVEGLWPTGEPAPPPSAGWLGQVIAYAGQDLPQHWAWCDGSLLQITDNPELFMLLGTTYGGDGEFTFALPDLRGRMVVGS